MTVRWASTAAEQWELAFEYIAKSNPAAAERIAGQILDLTEMLAVHPMAGKLGRVRGTRELVVPRTPFILVYGVDSARDVVWIYAIYHAARKWPDRF